MSASILYLREAQAQELSSYITAANNNPAAKKQKNFKRVGRARMNSIQKSSFESWRGIPAKHSNYEIKTNEVRN